VDDVVGAPSPVRVAREVMVERDGRPSSPSDTRKATRRRFDAAYKLRILDEYDQLTESGEKSMLLRREGLYSRLICDWRRQRRQGQLESGRRDEGRGGPSVAEVKRLRRDNARLRAKLEKAETIIEVQGKVSALLRQAIETSNIETYSSGS
jgi:transposase